MSLVWTLELESKEINRTFCFAESLARVRNKEIGIKLQGCYYNYFRVLGNYLFVGLTLKHSFDLHAASLHSIFLGDAHVSILCWRSNS